MKTTKATTGAVACALGASELRERREEFRTRLLDRIATAQETEDGYAFAFAPGSIDVVREFVALESECCGFMTYTVDDRDGQTWLTLSGPEGTKEFVREIWLGRTAEKQPR